MNEMVLGVITVSLFLAAARSQDSPPPQASSFISESCDSLCSCEAKDGIVYLHCDHRNISTISQIKAPPGLPFHLNLYKNELVELRAEEMEELKHALSLHIGGNSIQELDPGVFSSFSSLKKLHINSNFLVSLKEDTFLGLVNLEFLQADTNFIRFIEPGAFNKLIHLKVLILNDNSVDFLPSNIFRFVPLTHLDLRGNRLQMLPYVGFLEHIGRIMELLLEDNDWVCDCDILHLQIWMENMRAQSAIGDVVCSRPQHLRGTLLTKVKKDILCPSHADINIEKPSNSLDMVVTPSSKAFIPKVENDSKIPTSIQLLNNPCFDQCSCHSHPVAGFLVHCQDRGIQKVSDIGKLQQSPAKLVISGNMIEKLFKYDFVAYDNLELLNLANNRIDYIDNETFLTLSSLTKLYLNGNRLDKLLSTTFVGLHNLEYLYLEYNLIGEIAPGTFNPLPNLKMLSINNNLLSSLPAQAFRNVPLIKLNLRKNLFTHLPVSNVLDQLESLEQLYLEDNPWDCSCDLLSLKQWVEKLRKDVLVGSILCLTPKKTEQTELRSLRHEVLCPGLVTFYSSPPGKEESVTATLGPDNRAKGLLHTITDTVPLSVLILCLLMFVLMIIFCSAGLVVLGVHRRQIQKNGLEEHHRDNSSSSPIHLHYSMYGQKTTHHTLTQRAGSSTLYEERAHSPIVQICRNPTYCTQHKEVEGDLDYSVDESSAKPHLCRRIMEKETPSPLLGNPRLKYLAVTAEKPKDLTVLANPGSLYRNILEREMELQQLGITEYLRKNMPQLQSAVEIQVPGHQEQLKLMETIMYSRPRKVMLEQTKNEYFELKANLHTEPDYLEVLDHQNHFN